jgi:hypothetical protein
MILQTSNLLDKLVESQGAPIPIDYSGGPRYMVLVKQISEDVCVGVYWRSYSLVERGNKRIWRKSWNLTRVPSSVTRRMDESGRSRYSELRRIGKVIRDLRTDLVRKKQRIFGTLQSVSRHDEPRMADAEREIDEFVI